MLSAIFLALTSILIFSIFTRADASLTIAVSHTAASRLLKDGQQATFFNAWGNNRSTNAEIYHLEARSKDGEPLALKGQTGDIDLAPG